MPRRCRYNFIASSERIACAAGIIFVPGELGIGQHLVERDLGKVRKEQEQAAHLRSERAFRTGRALPASATSAASGSSRCGPFVVSPSRECERIPPSLRIVEIEAGLSCFPTLIQGIPDVVHRRVLLAQGDDLLTKSLPGRRQLGLFVCGRKNCSLRRFCGTHGTGRENSRVCSRTARPPLLTGLCRRKRAQSPRTVDGLGWRGAWNSSARSVSAFA